MTTIHSLLQHGRAVLQQTSDAPDLDTERLLLHVLQQTEASWLYAHREEPLSTAAQSQLRQLLQRRAAGEPLAYILEQQHFFGRSFLVNRHVLIPRPATETLVEQALQLIARLSAQKNRPLIIADIGTGSGCIAITLAQETDPTTVAAIYATDISAPALEVARHNAQRHGVEKRITFRQGDLLEPLHEVRLDLIVSNPPYVPTNELATIEHNKYTDGLAFEPRMALDGGADGNAYLQRLRRSRIPLLAEGGNGEVTLYE